MFCFDAQNMFLVFFILTAFIWVIRCMLVVMSVSWFHCVIVCSSFCISWGSVHSMKIVWIVL